MNYLTIRHLLLAAVMMLAAFSVQAADADKAVEPDIIVAPTVPKIPTLPCCHCLGDPLSSIDLSTVPANNWTVTYVKNGQPVTTPVTYVTGTLG